MGFCRLTQSLFVLFVLKKEDLSYNDIIKKNHVKIGGTVFYGFFNQQN